MQIGSISSAMTTALNAINRSADKVQNVAETVAAGLQSAPGEGSHSFTAALVSLPGIRQEIRANAAVIRTADDLFAEINSLLRR